MDSSIQQELDCALAIDIGGSHVTAALVDLTQRTVLENSRTHRWVNGDAGAEELYAAWCGAGLLAAASVPAARVRHAGIGMPGPFEYESGVSYLEHKFAALYGQNVGAELRRRWAGSPLEGAGVFFANDAAVWALGEWWGGAGRGLGRMIGVTLGTGLGSGFVDHGHILSRGETVPPDGQIWNLPYRDGIAEDYAAGRVITREYAQCTGTELSAREVAAQATAGDEQARAVFAELGRQLARILIPWVERFQPDGLVVGGNIARSWDLFSPALQSGLPGLVCLPTHHFETSSLLGGAVLGL